MGTGIRQRAANALLAASAAVLAACSVAPTKLDPPQPPFTDGWQWKSRGVKQERPRFCIAHSGGGLRSAAFNFGVLSGLAENGDLRSTEMVAAVSGGSYALSAVLAHHFNTYRAHESAPTLADAISDEKFRSRIVQFGSFITAAEMREWGFESFGSFFGNLLENGIFGRHANTTDMAFRYRERICETFQSRPGEARRTSCYADQAIPLSLLGEHAKRHGWPYYILVGTANLIEAGNADEHALSDIVFEFTPTSYGSDVLGRYEHMSAKVGDCDKAADTGVRPLCLPDAIAISGAAVDATEVSSILAIGVTGRKVLSGLNQDLGWNIANPLVSEETRRERRWLIWPAYKDELDTRGVKGSHFFVSDGGHSDNLGAFSLVRRLCDQIIIADGEYDPNYEFDGYAKLKPRLKAQLGLDLQVPAIDEALKSAGDLAKRYDERREIEYFGYKEAVRQRRMELETSFGQQPVLRGSVRPVAGWPQGELLVTYLKLSHYPRVEIRSRTAEPNANDLCRSILDAHCRDGTCGEYGNKPIEENGPFIESLGLNLVDFYGCWSAERDNSFLQRTFPHESTADLNYSPLQMRAYVELGKRIVRTCGSALHADGSRSCFQRPPPPKK